MTDIRQCWAYNTNSQRCDMPAGHPGNHAIQQEWADSECLTPNRPPLTIEGTTPKGTPELPMTHVSVTPPAPVKCVACNHHHKSGICKCGCHEHIG